MKIKLVLLFFIFICMMSCSISDTEFIERINSTDRIEIRERFHGGIAGTGLTNYVVKRSGYFYENEDWILVRDEDTQFQTYIQLSPDELSIFKSFITKAFETHDSNRTNDNSCTTFGPNPNEYDIQVGFYKKHLQPDEKTDSLFYRLTGKFCETKHVYE
ncbi:hypothetical protein OO013_07920 [Mangrovivirga sp. M17]|uniref:Lipoprotein n=1 Tax=Mangrovivirga halotolerans TaxID=2993936 RepID=A0ABT3RQC9_9BACT|nr:hypothetical protein [Mangrovivirga halotolerans]MCX2743787.1 hypothetical protein [Mangrovivirga halotolerans]